jgi:hypothetical protein
LLPSVAGKKVSLSCIWDYRYQFISYQAKADRYLAGWQAGLLNPMGHAVLVNFVLDSQLIYAMCALPIPPGIFGADGSTKKILSLGW